MSRWLVEFRGKSEDDLANLDLSTRRRVIERLEWLAEHFNEITPLPLGGPWRGFFKLRVGDWRVVYEIEHNERLIVIHYIDHRGKVYKRRRL